MNKSTASSRQTQAKPPKPQALAVQPEQIPDELKALKQWVCWRYEYQPKRNPKKPWTKVPYSERTRRRASSINPETWGTFEAVLACYQKNRQTLDGIGLVLCKDNHVAGIDLDHCRDPDTGAIEGWAWETTCALKTYTEISPSGTGLRAFMVGTLPGTGRHKNQVEVYDQGRYLTVTGHHLEGTPATIEPRQDAISRIYAHLAPTPKTKPRTHAPHPNGSAPRLEDDQLLEKALAARNGDKLARLWAGDMSEYPSQSEADLALCALLAFWSQDAVQLDRLFRCSRLMRDKWDEVHGAATYGQLTIKKALAQQTEHWTGARARAQQDQSQPQDESNGTILPPEQDEDASTTGGEQAEADGTAPPQDDTDSGHGQERTLPRLELTSLSPLRDLIQDALRHWVQANEPARTFVRAGQLVRVRTDEHGRPLIDQMGEAHVRGALMRCVDFGIYVERKEDVFDFHHKAPPRDLVQDLLAQGQWPFPALESVVEIPIVRPDGSILHQPGYDVTTRVYYQPAAGLDIPPIPTSPTSHECKQAFLLITKAIGDFPYVNAASVANAFAALFTPVVRHCIDGCVPMALIDKPQAGTGASLFTKILTLIGTGRTAAMMSAPTDDEEWRKKITALLEEGASVIVIDNVERPLWAPSLGAALTSTLWGDRTLGKNENLYLPQRACWLVTGNNLRLRGDLPRRCYWIRMDAKTARPWERTGFTHDDLEGWVRTHRGGLLVALLTLVRSWYAAGCPKASVPTLGGFERWAITVGSILAHLGINGFLQNREALYEQLDEDGPQWEVLLTVWYETWGEKPHTVAEIIEAFQQASCAVRDVLPDELAGALPAKDAAWGGFARKLGSALAKKVDVRYGLQGLHLHKAGEYNRAMKWQVAASSK